MNYIKQLNSFYDLLLTNPLNANSQCLYYALLNINNKCNWKKEFTVANSTIMTFTGLNKGQLERARNQLVQNEYIKYTKGENKNKAPTYEIIILNTQNDTQPNTQPSTQTNTQPSTQTNTQPNTQPSTQTEPEPILNPVLNPVPLNKQNKTKQKEINKEKDFLRGVEEIYNEYPKKSKRVDVEEWFKQNNPDYSTRLKMYENAKKLKETKQFKEEGARYMPKLIDWLNNGNYLDEVIVEDPEKGKAKLVQVGENAFQME